MPDPAPSIALIPAQKSDRQRIYTWLAKSDLTACMLGPPDFADHPIPTFEQFQADYQDYFYDGSQPELGRSYLIAYQTQMVGQINYQACLKTPDTAELDIWLAGSEFTNNGIGTRAIQLLAELLFNGLFKRLLLAPSRRNARAIRAYQKIGFRETAQYLPDQLDYHDSITLVLEKASFF